MIKMYATYGLYGGWVFHVSRWYDTDSIVYGGIELLNLED
jgi:hypothetical protein